MSMSVDEILDTLDDMLDEAWSLPLSGGKCMVNAEKVRGIIDDIRLQMPTEVRQAKAIVADRGEIIKNARGEAESIIRVAEEKARALVSEEEIVKQAQKYANDLVAQAQNQAKEIRQFAIEYSDSIFKTMEDSLVQTVNELRHAKASLKNTK